MGVRCLRKGGCGSTTGAREMVGFRQHPERRVQELHHYSVRCWETVGFRGLVRQLLGVVGVGIVNGGWKAYKFLSREDREEQSATIRLLAKRFLDVKESFRNSGARGDLRTAVDVKLKQLERYVEELDKWDLALNSGNVYQRNKRGRRKAAKRIETLRTGISVIEKLRELLAGMDFPRGYCPNLSIRVASRSLALVNTLQRISSQMCGQRFSERKVTLMLLALHLESTIMAFLYFCGSSGFAAVIEELLKQLEKTAEELWKRIWSDKLHRNWETLTLKRVDKRIGELRTGISDIDNALTLAASLRSLNQVGPGMSQLHQMSAPAPDPDPASAPDPAQIHVQMNFIFNLPCPVALNLDNGQVQGHNRGGMVDEAAPIDSLLIGFPKQV